MSPLCCARFDSLKKHHHHEIVTYHRRAIESWHIRVAVTRAAQGDALSGLRILVSTRKLSHTFGACYKCTTCILLQAPCAILTNSNMKPKSRHCRLSSAAGQLQPSHLRKMGLKASSRWPGQSEAPGIQNHSDVPYAMSTNGTGIKVSNAAAGGATEDAAACEVWSFPSWSCNSDASR